MQDANERYANIWRAEPLEYYEYFDMPGIYEQGAILVVVPPHERTRSVEKP